MMRKRKFKVILNQENFNELQESIDYYNRKQHKLGDRFLKEVKKRVRELSSDFHLYEVKYDAIRCIAVPKFPFLIHYRIDETLEMVFVEAITHMSMDPEKNWIKQ
jgi:hypothetical protein